VLLVNAKYIYLVSVHPESTPECNEAGSFADSDTVAKNIRCRDIKYMNIIPLNAGDGFDEIFPYTSSWSRRKSQGICVPVAL